MKLLFELATGVMKLTILKSRHNTYVDVSSPDPYYKSNEVLMKNMNAALAHCILQFAEAFNPDNTGSLFVFMDLLLDPLQCQIEHLNA